MLKYRQRVATKESSRSFINLFKQFIEYNNNNPKTDKQNESNNKSIYNKSHVDMTIPRRTAFSFRIEETAKTQKSLSGKLLL